MMVLVHARSKATHIHSISVPSLMYVIIARWFMPTDRFGRGSVDVE